jgi:hypothetical protein
MARRLQRIGYETFRKTRSTNRIDHNDRHVLGNGLQHTACELCRCTGVNQRHAERWLGTEIEGDMKLEEIIQALDQGKTVYWTNTAYKVHYVEIDPSNAYQSRLFSRRGNEALRITCIENYFGSLAADETELNQCFLKDA